MSFPDDEILIALLRGPKDGMTVLQLREVTNRADSTIRNNIKTMGVRYGTAWVEPVVGSRSMSKHIGARYRLTERGREIARSRARRSR